MDFFNDWRPLLQETFWDPGFWLPKGTNWNDMKMPNKRLIRIGQLSDLNISIGVIPCVLLVRYFLTRFVFVPLGIRIGVANQNHSVKFIDKDTELQRTRPTKLTKFTESAWKTTWHSCYFLFGIWVLHNKSWMLDIKETWRNYPYHDLSQDVFIYYIIGIGYYFALTISQFTDVKRRDFLEMFLHHIATIFLMVMSYTLNVVRFGTLVLVLHDPADIFLQLAKSLRYAKLHFAKNISFACFVIVWFITRLWLFPVHLIWSTIFEAPVYINPFPAFTIMMRLCYILFLLHLFWTWYVMKLVLRSISQRDAKDDSRSDSEESEDEGTGPAVKVKDRKSD